MSVMVPEPAILQHRGESRLKKPSVLTPARPISGKSSVLLPAWQTLLLQESLLSHGAEAPTVDISPLGDGSH